VERNLATRASTLSELDMAGFPPPLLGVRGGRRKGMAWCGWGEGGRRR